MTRMRRSTREVHSYLGVGPRPAAWGGEVDVVADGEAALNAVGESAPDLVLLDIMLPKINGFDVCQKLRADPRWRGLKIIMLTAKGREADQAKGMALGADAFVTKPFATKDLVAQVQKLLAP